MLVFVPLRALAVAVVNWISRVDSLLFSCVRWCQEVHFTPRHSIVRGRSDF
eukprot:m.1410225 g.1410225  ORF g.1410225 m.1410225 type:complete len:51 (-) comp25023_c2_seq19:3011-3163(-)